MSSATASPHPRPQPRPRPAEGKRRVGPLGITLGVLVALVLIVFALAQFQTEVWWYTQLGYARVLWVRWGSQIVLFLIGFALMFGPVAAGAHIAWSHRPTIVPTTERSAAKVQYRQALEPLRHLVVWGAPALLGIFAGLSAAGRWEMVQLWLHRLPFGQQDPVFGKDLSFYIYSLPVLSYLTGFAVTVLAFTFVIAAFLHFIYDGVVFQVDQARHKVSLVVSRAARIELSVLGALIMVAVAVLFWLARYETLISENGVFYGAGYTDVHAGIPAQGILAGIALFVAGIFVVTAFRGDWRLPALGIGLMVLTGILVGGLYPLIVQKFTVEPNAQELEQPYIQSNIDATRDAFGLDAIDVQSYDATTTAEAGALREDAETTASIRLLDPNVVSPAFSQLQQNKQYYSFAQTLAVDKYTFDGQSHDTVIAARELNLDGLSADQRNWTNEHTVYTHGYGVVAAYGNQVRPEGSPSFFEGDIPPVGELSELSDGGYEPRIYFSPSVPDYSIVGAPEGTAPWELDYPDDSAEGKVSNTFPTSSVSAGPEVGNLWAQLLYAVKFRSEQIFFSDRVTDVSQILYDRDPSERVEKVAPYLTLDGRVYPAVVDGKVLWILDGYTTSSTYPYAAPQALDTATTDSLTASSSAITALAPQQVNYLRNSVKATVDAYSGEVTLYAWDDQDPILRSWQEIFPTTVKPMSEISGELMSHIRYPEDMFKVQRSVLTKYHVTNATDFFTAQDFWAVPVDPTTTTASVGDTAQPPYYVTLQMPNEESSFSLTTSFIPYGGDREILTGFLAANADAGSEAGVKSDTYGKLSLLVLPRNATVPGPGQVQNQFNSDGKISEILTYLKQGNAQVRQGNLLTLPVGGGLLYVQPVYAQSSQGTQFPLLRYVVVGFGDKVAISTTLSGALDEVFGGDSGAATAESDGATSPSTGGEDDGGTPSATPAPSTSPSAEPSDQPSASPTTEPAQSPTAAPAPAPTDATEARQVLDQALLDMEQAVKDGDDALAQGDFAAYGEAQERLQAALDQAMAAYDALGQ